MVMQSSLPCPGVDNFTGKLTQQLRGGGGYFCSNSQNYSAPTPCRGVLKCLKFTFSPLLGFCEGDFCLQPWKVWGTVGRGWEGNILSLGGGTGGANGRVGVCSS
ncbi:Hypothetical predicted protein [Podarcis lilfordi]|uniref:Uncharacterized protein n=1 Tax=Podarcis lilfordi TaxID=74358 RepID=A0AA35PT67_9SAUR|nr:Hypothetical predicted protein [Podarcis lilfordi]